MEGLPKKSSKIEKAVRSALAGAAFLGAVGGTEVSTEGGLPQMQMAEAQESFDANREAAAFLDEITGLEGDQHLLAALVEEKFNVFALALEQRIPVFTEGGSVGGSLGAVSGNAQARERAKALLVPPVRARAGEGNPALGILSQIVNERPLSPQNQEELQKLWKEMGN